MFPGKISFAIFPQKTMNKPSPTYFEHLAIYDNPLYFEKVIDIEWRGQLKSSTGNTRFKIKYYGEIYSGLIGGTDDAPSLVHAVDATTGEEILLFDGCKHGYDAMLCDDLTAQMPGREVSHFYTGKNGADTFDVILSVYYNVDYDDEAENFLNENGMVTLSNGEEISLDILKRNGFDAISIYVVNDQKEIIRVVEEELA